VAEALRLAGALVQQQLAVFEQARAALFRRHVARALAARHGGSLLEDPWIAQRADALRTIERSTAGIPEIRRVSFGRRVRHGLPGYEQLMPQDFEFALIVEVDDIDALKRYLQAPGHTALGSLFYTATSAALAYDYEF
jgi:hypothetical protein